MDIRKNKIFLHQNMRRFALKATASAIATLSAETATADTCPTYIINTSLAGVVCDFDSTSSVTDLPPTAYAYSFLDVTENRL